MLKHWMVHAWILHFLCHQPDLPRKSNPWKVKVIKMELEKEKFKANTHKHAHNMCMCVCERKRETYMSAPPKDIPIIIAGPVQCLSPSFPTLSLQLASSIGPILSDVV